MPLHRGAAVKVKLQERRCASCLNGFMDRRIVVFAALPYATGEKRYIRKAKDFNKKN